MIPDIAKDIAKIGKQNFETFAAIQKQVLDALVKADRQANLGGDGRLPGVGAPANGADFQPSKKGFQRDPEFHEGLRTDSE